MQETLNKSNYLSSPEQEEGVEQEGEIWKKNSPAGLAL
jgi:hypothetical protein